MLTLGEYGGRLIFAGDVDNGMKKLREAHCLFRWNLLDD